MKNLILFLAFSLFIIGASSCKKSYQCDCVYIDDQTGDTVSTITQTFEATKSDAETRCVSSTTTSSGGISVTVNCDLSPQ